MVPKTMNNIQQIFEIGHNYSMLMITKTNNSVRTLAQDTMDIDLPIAKQFSAGTLAQQLGKHSFASVKVNIVAIDLLAD